LILRDRIIISQMMPELIVLVKGFIRNFIVVEQAIAVNEGFPIHFLPNELQLHIFEKYLELYRIEGASFIREKDNHNHGMVRFMLEQAYNFSSVLTSNRSVEQQETGNGFISWITGKNYINITMKSISDNIVQHYYSLPECKHRFLYMLEEQRKREVEESKSNPSIL
jgi:hypothetical protein